MHLLCRLSLLAAMLVVAPAWAQDWGQVVNVSATMGINGNRLCYGEASRGDIGCPSDAPIISGSTISGTFLGDGSGLTGVTVATDRIVSGTSAAIITPDGTVTMLGRLEIVTGTNVVSLGKGAGYSNTGSNVTVVGKSAGNFNSGSNVAALGDFAGQNNPGSALTAVGHAAAQNNTGNNVTALGAWAGTSNTFSNVTLLGYNVYTADKSNQVVLGNGNVVEVSTSGVYVGKGVSITGTISATNFVGNGSGLTGISTVTDRIISGTASAIISPSGNLNVRGLLDIVTSSNVVGIGSSAAKNNTGVQVTALGYAAAQNNTANYLTAVGYAAALSNNMPNVTAVGTNAGYSNSGTNVTAVGMAAAQNNTGSNLAALGYSAGQNNSGDYSTLVGGLAGQNNTMTHLTGIGYFAAKDNTSAFVTAVGEEAGQLNSGYALAAMGVAAGKYNTGSNSTVIGSYAGQYNTGLNAVALGYLAGRNNMASNVTALGAYAVQSASVSNTFINVTGVGFNAQPNKSNQVILGDGNIVEVSTTGIYVGAGVSTTGAISATTGYFSSNVGIGVTSPSKTLHVAGPILVSATGTGAWPTDAGNVLLYAAAPTGPFPVLQFNVSNNKLMVGNGGANWQTGLVLMGGNADVIIGSTYVSNSLVSKRVSGYVGIQTTNPQTMLDVAGSIRISADASATTNTCDTNRSGAIRYNGSTFQVCYGSGGWANLADASSTVATVDRITSGTAQVIANGNSGYVSLTNGASTWGYLGVSQTYLGAANFGGKVGIGTVTPAVALEISGTVSATVLQLADGPAITCGPSTYGTMKMVNGRPYYCRQ
ncbi:beta strand repeat-containing protein [Mesorhizobium newzealandense]|uniref:Beta strand repeat-containing protein n=1 Tax=Mesorhizobium newzealandense TaxID=1300302 RepID=A0ABW4U751_9HYPH